jgi:SSS family solute:Na+ symporter
MVFVGVFEVPFTTGHARSVRASEAPICERHEASTRSFATMTIFSSGISMYAMGLCSRRFSDGTFHFSVLISGLVVLAYSAWRSDLGDLQRSAAVFLIVLGFLPLVQLGLKDAGGWSGLTRLSVVSTSQGYAPNAFSQSWLISTRRQQILSALNGCRWSWDSDSYFRSDIGAQTFS